MRRSAAPSQSTKRVKQSATTYKTSTKSLPKKQSVLVRTSTLTRGVKTNAGFPPTLLFSHKAFIPGTWSCTGTSTFYRISCNGLFNCDATGAAKQPMFFDQLTPIYNHYRVLGAKITWVFSNVVGNTVPANIVCYLNDDITSPVISAAAEHRTGQTRQLPLGSDSQVTVSQTWSINEYFPRQKYDDELKGTTVANPNEQMFFNASFRAADGIATCTGVFYANVEYITEWSELKDTAGS